MSSGTGGSVVSSGLAVLRRVASVGSVEASVAGSVPPHPAKLIKTAVTNNIAANRFMIFLPFKENVIH